VLGLVVLLTARCTGGSDTNTPDASATINRTPVYSQAIVDAASEAGIVLLLPKAVPEPLFVTPSVDQSKLQVVILFSSDKNEDKRPYLLEIYLSKSPSSCPPCPGHDPPNVKYIQTRWGLTSEIQNRSLGAIADEFSFRRESNSIDLTVHWYFSNDAPTELPPELHAESIRIVESLEPASADRSALTWNLGTTAYWPTPPLIQSPWSFRVMSSGDRGSNHSEIVGLALR
jgi:hypothetical protein